MAVRGSIWAVSTGEYAEVIASYLVRWLSRWCTVRSVKLRDDEVDRIRLVRLSAMHPGSKFLNTPTLKNEFQKLQRYCHITIQDGEQSI